MADEVHEKRRLDQWDAVQEIEKRFGEEHLYENENGNPAISRRALKEFRKLTPDVVWERWDREWRLRAEHDEPGRRGID